MPRFFIDKNIVTEDSVILTGDDAHHISRSLRMRAGEELTLCDGEGFDYNCTIEEIDEFRVTKLRVLHEPQEEEEEE